MGNCGKIVPGQDSRHSKALRQGLCGSYLRNNKGTSEG